MDTLNIIINFIKNYSIYFLIINSFLVFFLFIINIRTRFMLNKLSAKYKKFLNVSDNINLEDLIYKSINSTNEVVLRNKEIENKINYLERNLQSCIQKIGVIRYNAFENVGSELSFAIALLDSNDNGVVINGLYSRESYCTFAKGIVGGKSKYTLSPEELQAMDVAKKSSR